MLKNSVVLPRGSLPQEQQGGDRRSEDFKVRNTYFEIARGKDTAGQMLVRLERERPDLLARVLAKELSVHRAAVLAGFRVERKCYRTDDVRKAVRGLLEVWSAEEIAEALKEELE